ncbi:cytochrome P450 [Kitasatospora sp. NPDC028055]|uniref:cytochrome P450 n=1 Tax=Kitasatospora sp. NPDC028055 TaxID=3155653 RepID=UPI0033CBF81C
MRITGPGDDGRQDGAPDPELVDLSDPHFYATGDPHAVWRHYRHKAPVTRLTVPSGRSYVSVTTHAETSTVLRDHALYTSRRGNMLSVLGEQDPAADRMMVASDPPIHGYLRRPVAQALSARELAARRAAIRRMARLLLAPLASGEPWDLAAAMTAFPMMFTGALMGLPEADWPELTRLTTVAIAPADPSSRDDSGGHQLVSAHHELFDYFAEVAADRTPREDLVGLLQQLTVGDRTIRLDEVIYNCYNVLLGANVTAPHVIATTVNALLEHPDQYRRLLDGGAGVASAVEEGLRWASPATHAMRYATEDTVLGGVPVREGEAVVAWLGSANRDETVFDDPYRFDLARTPNRHVAFGFGPHYCVGAPLARIALGEFFTEVTELVERFEPAGPVEHLASNFIAGIKHLPVTARLRPGAARQLAEPVPAS